ncbi:hypothetical protein [Clostridium oryzae]|uniref:Uncharacterized protein n=1 Tax=Clostridium oryzae TaxID=1450648 RepID=A0A1V4IHU5_9CLOT|nr:hypothetical protein [Clostridium oryzae]OPJ59430.1 hypothetical protein CLORY_32720 [Clostridium oryzae]
MNKKIIAAVLTSALAFTTVLPFFNMVQKNSTQSEQNVLAKSASSADKTSSKNVVLTTTKKASKTLQKKTSKSTQKKTSKSKVAVASSKKTNNSSKSSFSRGGSLKDIKNAAMKESSSSNNSAKTKVNNKIELLDWWKKAQYAFARNTKAEVLDIATGKTFKVVRTMGTNHADAEALTKQDTNIIKSIWGGFSWQRRPIILIVNGRRLAASMSAMPHAGLDSKPAYAKISNRSAGYGTGLNLDVIKNNGMDGHFDIHFLNSTRHMDGQEDSQHQAAIMKAAK